MGKMRSNATISVRSVLRAWHRHERTVFICLTSNEVRDSVLPFPHQPGLLALGQRRLSDSRHARHGLVDDQDAVVDRQQEDLYDREKQEQMPQERRDGSAAIRSKPQKDGDGNGARRHQPG